MNRVMQLVRRVALPLLLVCPMLTGLPQTARAERVTEQEARRVAENYIRFVVRQDGGWDRHATARVISIEPFRRGDRVLGYFCPVEPVGYFVIALDRELAPIRCYSTRSNLDPNAEGGMTDLLKGRLERLYAAIGRTLGHAPSAAEDFGAVLPVSFRATWQTLADPAFAPERYVEERGSRSVGMDYQEGETLLLTTWSQEPPYNDDCPDHGCTWGGYGFYNTNAYVGCVATAGAQVMKYWNWPPTGEGGIYADPYDWPNMTGTYIHYSDTLFVNGQGDLVTYAQIRAVAEISHEIGVAVDMDYGCDASGSLTSDMEGVYENHYRYSPDCESAWWATYEEQWQMLTTEISLNRPVQYRIPEHSIVGDGWKDEWIGDPYRWIHVVYGWNGGNDGWWPPLEIPGGDFWDEYIVCQIYPNCSLGDDISGLHGGGEYGYVYFDRDVHSQNGAILPGTKAQVLRSGFLLENTGTLYALWIMGQTTNGETRVFMNGDEAGDTRIRVYDGAVKVDTGGQLVLN